MKRLCELRAPVSKQETLCVCFILRLFLFEKKKLFYSGIMLVTVLLNHNDILT